MSVWTSWIQKLVSTTSRPAHITNWEQVEQRFRRRPRAHRGFRPRGCKICMGFRFKYGIEDMVKDSVALCLAMDSWSPGPGASLQWQLNERELQTAVWLVSEDGWAAAWAMGCYMGLTALFYVCGPVMVKFNVLRLFEAHEIRANHSFIFKASKKNIHFKASKKTFIYKGLMLCFNRASQFMRTSPFLNR